MDIDKLNKTINEALELNKPPMEYYYEVSDGSYTISGHYWNDDIHAYTPEGDSDGYTEGFESDTFDTWEELIDDLDNEGFLCSKVEDMDPTQVESVQTKIGKLLCEYETTKYETHEDDYGHYWEGEVYYTVYIYEREKDED